MADSLPTTTQQWTVSGSSGVSSLIFHPSTAIPTLGPRAVLIHLKGASLNARDISISRGEYPWPVKDNVVPGSDGAGIVLAVGDRVGRFKPGDQVVTLIVQGFLTGSMTAEINKTGLGAKVDGTFRSIGAFDEDGLVHMPKGLSFIEAATLSCAGVSAWNALFGLQGKQVTKDQWVLTQGTGGVSLFAVQFAKSVGAKVIATTSSDAKAPILRELGADHVINYRDTPDWGAAAKEVTGGVGVDLVVDVAGPRTLKQSMESLRLDGTITVMGIAGGAAAQDQVVVPTVFDSWISLFTARGIWVGNREHMEDMCRAIEANVDQLRPVVDQKVFSLGQLREAYEYLEKGGHQGKVCIEIE